MAVLSKEQSAEAIMNKITPPTNLYQEIKPLAKD